MRIDTLTKLSTLVDMAAHLSDEFQLLHGCADTTEEINEAIEKYQAAVQDLDGWMSEAINQQEEE